MPNKSHCERNVIFYVLFTFHRFINIFFHFCFYQFNNNLFDTYKNEGQNYDHFFFLKFSNNFEFIYYLFLFRKFMISRTKEIKMRKSNIAWSFFIQLARLKLKTCSHLKAMRDNPQKKIQANWRNDIRKRVEKLNEKYKWIMLNWMLND